MFGEITSTTCQHCGAKLAANTPRIFGFVQAVHLLDEHPEEFETLAADARRMIENTESGVKEAESVTAEDPITAGDIQAEADDAEYESVFDIAKGIASDLIEAEDELDDETTVGEEVDDDS